MEKAYANCTSTADNTLVKAAIHKLLEITLKPVAKVLEHGGASGEDDVLVQSTSDVNGGLLDDVVNDLW